MSVLTTFRYVSLLSRQAQSQLISYTLIVCYTASILSFHHSCQDTFISCQTGCRLFPDVQNNLFSVTLSVIKSWLGG